MKSTDVRQSNFELLRIIAIFMVLVHHSLFEANTIGYKKVYTFDDGYMGVFLNSFCIIGVNLFILISGWFGCKKTYRKIVLILVEVTLFSGIGYILGCMFGLTNFDIFAMLKAMNFFNNWFVVSYILLLMLIPVVNEILTNDYVIKVAFDKKFIKCNEFYFNKSTLCVFILALISVFFGWGMGILNVDGYNVVNFVFLYTLSNWLRQKLQINKMLSGFCLVVIYILSAVLLSGLFFLIFGYLHKESTTFNTMRLMGYNNPLVLISSVAFFCLFARFKIKSNLINNVASAVLGVFMIHEVPAISEFWRSFALSAYQHYSYIGLIIYDIVLFVILCFLSYLIKSFLINPVLCRCSELLKLIRVFYCHF